MGTITANHIKYELKVMIYTPLDAETASKAKQLLATRDQRMVV